MEDPYIQGDRLYGYQKETRYSYAREDVRKIERFEQDPSAAANGVVVGLIILVATGVIAIPKGD